MTICFLIGLQWGKMVSMARVLLDQMDVPSK